MRHAEHRALKVRAGDARDGADLRSSRAGRLYEGGRSGAWRPRKTGPRRTELGGVRGTAAIFRRCHGGRLPKSDHRLFEPAWRVRRFRRCRRSWSSGGRSRWRLSGERTLHADHGAAAEQRVRAVRGLGGSRRRCGWRRLDEWRRYRRRRSRRRGRGHAEHGLLQSRPRRRGRRRERRAARRASLCTVGVRLSASGATQHFYAL
jgi:hypothetical protein